MYRYQQMLKESLTPLKDVWVSCYFGINFRILTSSKDLWVVWTPDFMKASVEVLTPDTTKCHKQVFYLRLTHYDYWLITGTHLYQRILLNNFDDKIVYTYSVYQCLKFWVYWFHANKPYFNVQWDTNTKLKGLGVFYHAGMISQTKMFYVYIHHTLIYSKRPVSYANLHISR